MASRPRPSSLRKRSSLPPLSPQHDQTLPPAIEEDLYWLEPSLCSSDSFSSGSESLYPRQSLRPSRRSSHHSTKPTSKSHTFPSPNLPNPQQYAHRNRRRSLQTTYRRRNHPRSKSPPRSVESPRNKPLVDYIAEELPELNILRFFFPSSSTTSPSNHHPNPHQRHRRRRRSSSPTTFSNPSSSNSLSSVSSLISSSDDNISSPPSSSPSLSSIITTSPTTFQQNPSTNIITTTEISITTPNNNHKIILVDDLGRSLLVERLGIILREIFKRFSGDHHRDNEVSELEQAEVLLLPPSIAQENGHVPQTNSSLRYEEFARGILNDENENEGRKRSDNKGLVTSPVSDAECF